MAQDCNGMTRFHGEIFIERVDGSPMTYADTQPLAHLAGRLYRREGLAIPHERCVWAICPRSGRVQFFQNASTIEGSTYVMSDDHAEWLRYLDEKLFRPAGYTLRGSAVCSANETPGDIWLLTVADGAVEVRELLTAGQRALIREYSAVAGRDLSRIRDF